MFRQMLALARRLPIFTSRIEAALEQPAEDSRARETVEISGWAFSRHTIASISASLPGVAPCELSYGSRGRTWRRRSDAVSLFSAGIQDGSSSIPIAPDQQS